MSSPHQAPVLSHPKYRPDIDGLRAIAVLSVIGFHAFGVSGGFTGVDIFFVISGFLISTIIFENLEKNSFSFSEFYQRRIRRIFPSLLLVLLACLIVGWFTLFADEYQELGKHVVSGAGFISNLVLWSESGYFDGAAEKKPLLHLWSLGVEEQFYVFWPILAYFLWRFRQYFLLLILGLIGISFFLNVWFIHQNGVATFYSPLTRFWELLLGSCLAYLMLYRQAFIARINTYPNTVGAIGFVLILGAIALFTKNLAFPGWWAVIPVLGACLLIVSGQGSWVGRNLFSNKVLVWFGLISFPLYLWHWPLLVFAKMLGNDSRLMIKIAMALAIFLAWLSYRYVEKPIRYGKNQKRNTILLILGMCLLAIGGSSIYLAGGVTSRIDDGQGGKLAAQYRSQLEWPETYNSSAACRAKYGADQYCLVGDDSKPPTVALIGDSHANHFYPGLNKYYQEHGGNLILLGSGGCPPFFDIDRIPKPPAPNLNCYKRTSHLYQFVLNDPQIKKVFIAFLHNLTFDADFIFDDKLNQITKTDNYQATVTALTRTIQALESKGKEVILLYDMPSLTRDVKSCAFKRPYAQQSSRCNLSDIAFVNDFDQYNQMIADVQQKTRLKVFDTRPYLKGNFPIDANGNLHYRDPTHLSYPGSLFFADKYDFEANSKGVSK